MKLPDSVILALHFDGGNEGKGWVHLHDEVMQWCRDNFRAPFDLGWLKIDTPPMPTMRFGSQQHREDMTTIAIPTPHIFFDSDIDMVFFKLRWFDGA